MLTVLEVCLWKPAVYKLKILGGGKFESYKSMGGTTKRGGAHIFKVQWGKQKGGITIFDLNLVGEKTMEETMLKARTTWRWQFTFYH